MKKAPHILCVLPPSGLERERFDALIQLCATFSIIWAGSRDVLRSLPLPTSSSCVVLLPAGGARTFWINFWRVLWVMLVQRVDMAHLYQGPTGARPAALAAKFLRCPFLLTYRRTSHPLSWIDRLILKWAVYVVVETQWDIQYLMGFSSFRAFVFKRKLCVIPPGIEPTIFLPGSVLQHGAQSFRISPKDCVVLGWPGVDPEEQKAFMETVLYGPRIFLLLPENALQPSVWEWLQDQQAPLERVRFFSPGWQSRLAYALAEAVVILKEECALPHIACAGAWGRPVLVLDSCPGHEVVLPGRTGWILSSFGSRVLSTCLRTVLSLPVEEKTSLGDRAQEWVRYYFSPKEEAQALKNIYQQMLQSP